MLKPLFTSVFIPAFCKFTRPITGRKNASSIVGLCRFSGASSGKECVGAPITRQKENSLAMNRALGLVLEDKGDLNSVQQEIVKALSSGERDRASSLLSELVVGKTDLTAEDFYHVMRYCSLKPDTLFVMETWNLMEENEIPLKGKCHHLTIQALCKGGYIEEAFNVLSSSVVTPTIAVYNSFLRASFHFKNLNYVDGCLNLMEHHALGKNEITYALLLKLVVLRKDLSAVNEMWNECVKMHPMSIIIFRKFIWAFSVLKDLESAYAVLQKMITISKNPFSQHVRRLLRWSFNDLLHVCAEMKHAELSKTLMDQIQSLGLKPSSATYDGYVRGLLSEKGYRFGIEQLGVMQDNNLKPHESTIAAISVSCSKALELDLAEELLFQRHICYAYPYNAFIQACDYLDQPGCAVRVFAKMRKANATPDIKTYELLFKLTGNVNASYEESYMLAQDATVKRIKYLEMDMRKHGIQHSLVSLENLMFTLGMEGLIKEMIWYLKVAEELFSDSDAPEETRIYDIVLHSLVKAEQTDLAIAIFKSMVSCGFPPNAAIYSIMIDCCSVFSCYRSACALFSMMIRGGFPLHRVTYTTLSKVLLSFDYFGEALKLMELARLDGIQLDAVSYNPILQRALGKGRLDVTEFIIEQMHQEKIRPDIFTCTFVFSTYIKNGLETTAIEALRVLCTRMIPERADITGEDSEAESVCEDLEDESVGVFRECVLQWLSIIGDGA